MDGHSIHRTIGMDLPCTQLIEDDPPAAEDEQTRPPQSDTFEARVFGSLVGADADGRKERISRNPLQFPIRGGPNKIGRDPTQCQIVVENQVNRELDEYFRAMSEV